MEKEKIATEEKKESYTLFWSGEEISTDYLSQYYANELDELKDENLLVGSFTSKGKYVFSPETKKALVSIKKKVEDKTDNSYFLVAKTFKNNFNFKMRVFEVEDETLLAANLYLIEVVDDERFTKPLKTFVAQYVDKKNDEFINKAKYIFNISIDGEFNEFERKENETIIEPVAPKPREKNEAALEIAYEKYIEAMLEELENAGELGKKIKAEFEKETKYLESKEKAKEPVERGDIEKEPLPKPNYKALKRKLDAIIEKNKGLEVLTKENPKIEEVVKKHNEAVAQEKENSKQIEIMPDDFKKLKEEEKKKDAPAAGGTAPKKEGAKKSSGASKSGGDGGGGKKADKKKDGGGGGKKKDKKKDSKDPDWKGAGDPKAKAIKIEKIDIAKMLKELEELSKALDKTTEPVKKEPEKKKEEEKKKKLPHKKVHDRRAPIEKQNPFAQDGDFSEDLEEYLDLAEVEKVVEETIAIDDTQIILEQSEEIVVEMEREEVVEESLYDMPPDLEDLDENSLLELEEKLKKQKAREGRTL